MGTTEKPTLLKWGTGKNFLTSASDSSSSSLFGSISHSEQKVDENDQEEKPQDDAVKEKEEEKEKEIEQTTTKEKEQEQEQDIVFQVDRFCIFLNVQSKVSVFELDGKEYKSRGKGLLKIIRFTIS